jgi:xeroderma pigmentosum group C-complementing protein
VRLVCSLQAVPFSPSVGPIISNTPGPTPTYTKDSPVGFSATETAVLHENEPRLGGGQSTFKPPRWLSRVNSANYFKDQFNESPRRPRPPKKRIHESPYPIFWVEVLDTAHLKWIPVNPFDATVLNKPKSFEPPASDPDNILSYVVAFGDDGIAKDVTRRYANAYNSKTRKNRVESLGGGKWWQKRLHFYSRFRTRSELEIDTLEDIYLADMEAREPMPRNIADFKDHPTYALQRHLRKNEVLIDGATIVGTTTVGKDATGRKKLENVYRRRDVRVVRSADKWFRTGRLVKDGEQPRKTVMRRNRGDEEDVEDDPGTGLYDIQQTEIYKAPPVVNGRVPKNSYGNLDIYVPSMIPPGACHLDGECKRTRTKEPANCLQTTLRN